MKAIKTTFIVLLMIASTLFINVNAQNADKGIVGGIPNNFGKVVAVFANGQIDSAMTKKIQERAKYPSINNRYAVCDIDFVSLGINATLPLSEANVMQTVTKRKDPALDTCKREYIALSRSYEDLKQDYADVVYINSMDKIYAQKAHEKELKKAKRKKWFNGFLWGNVVGILALAFVMK